MLQPIYYIINADAWSDQNRDLTNGIIALRVDPSSKQGVQNCFQMLQNSRSHFQFCLCVPASLNIDDESVNNVIAYFFFANYYQPAQIPLVILEEEHQKGFETFSAALKKAALQQGYQQVQLLSKSQQAAYTIDERERLGNDYSNALKGLVEKSFYIAVSDVSEISVLEQMLQGVEDKFAVADPDRYNMLKENKTLREKVAQLQFEALVYEQEIRHMASHLDVLRSTTQASSLQQYYNNEYEVLPRWYKQLGHVLKVIQGKRTIQSLFDKTAKKYNT